MTTKAQEWAECINMENKKVAFLTLGCKVNQYETNAMIQDFIKNGYELVAREIKHE